MLMCAPLYHHHGQKNMFPQLCFSPKSDPKLVFNEDSLAPNLLLDICKIVEPWMIYHMIWGFLSLFNSSL